MITKRDNTVKPDEIQESLTSKRDKVMYGVLGTMCLFITAILVLAVVILIKVMDKAEVTAAAGIQVPPLPGVAQNGEKPKIILA